MRAHDYVVTRIETDLADGRWVVGDQLPEESVLAKEYGSPEPVVREAIRVLEALGVVSTLLGRASGPVTLVAREPALGVGAAVRLHIAAGGFTVRDVVEMRVLLETWAVARGAERVREDREAEPEKWAESAASSQARLADHIGGGLSTAASSGGEEWAEGSEPDEPAAVVRRIDSLLDLMDASDLSPLDFQEYDAELHANLVRLAGNPLIEAVMMGLREAIAAYIAIGSERLPHWSQTAERLRSEHRGIVAAVKEGAGALAADALRAHIEGFFAEAGM